ncbi:unnamed protein product [Arabidopsis thaliana]|uniref:(thale cress) hypothetical protein n=1 Tax=Arabidopsis thaliana TaxID=3702 RepID=A0A7G2ENL0_ARATH|nr:unnamed protein product [Arabidopsis thaliana]
MKSTGWYRFPSQVFTSTTLERLLHASPNTFLPKLFSATTLTPPHLASLVTGCDQRRERAHNDLVHLSCSLELEAVFGLCFALKRGEWEELISDLRFSLGGSSLCASILSFDVFGWRIRRSIYYHRRFWAASRRIHRLRTVVSQKLLPLSPPL